MLALRLTTQPSLKQAFLFKNMQQGFGCHYTFIPTRIFLYFLTDFYEFSVASEEEHMFTHVGLGSMFSTVKIKQ